MTRKTTLRRLAVLAVMLACLLTAAAGLAGDERVDAFLEEQAKDQSSPWVLAILESGAREVSWEENTATFMLRSFDPRLKELGSYGKAEDRAAWRTAMLENMAEWNLQVQL